MTLLPSRLAQPSAQLLLAALLTSISLPGLALADGMNGLQPYSTTNTDSLYYRPMNTANTNSDLPALRANVSAIPAGQALLISLNEPVSSQTARVGDSIEATLAAPILVEGRTVVPAGSEVRGTVTHVSEASRLGKHGEVEVRFLSIQKPSGENIPMEATVVTTNGTPILKGDTYKMDVAKGVGIAALGTGIGAVGGTAVGGLLGVAGTGAAVGTAVGAGVGIGYAVGRKGRSVDLAKGTHLSIKLTQPATIVGSAY